MIDFLAILPACLLGWILIRLIAPGLGRGWARWLTEMCLGVGLGAAITSTVYFLTVWAGFAGRTSILVFEIGGLIAAGAMLFRRARPVNHSAKIASPSWIWWLRGAAILALCIFAMDVSEGLTASPSGEYDAAAIWNLRARYLAGGAPTWRYAVSDKTGTNHPGYPLLTSGFIARSWVLIGDLRSSTPSLIGLLFPLATIGLLCGVVTTAAGEALGLLAMLLLLATEGFVSQATAQYADVPLSFYILASLGLLALAAMREWPPQLLLLAGCFGGFAAWTKNEGLPFVAFLCVAALWRGGFRALKWIAAGAAPAVLLTLIYKMALVDGRETMFPSSAGQAMKLLSDGSRWMEIIRSFGRNIFELGFAVSHPILLIAVLAWAFGFVPKQDFRARFWLLLAPLGLLATDFVIYLITMAGLTWHLSTSNNRVIVQVWPALLFGFFLMLRTPVVATIVKPPEPVPVERKRRK